VVQVKEGDPLVVFSQPPGTIQNVKLTDANNAIATLSKISDTEFSLEGFPTGAYVLDVVTEMGANRAAFETLLVILRPDQQPIQPQQLTQLVQIDIEIRDEFIFPPDDNQTNPDPDLPPEECDEGYRLVDGFCEPIICPADSQDSANGQDGDNPCQPIQPIVPINPIDPEDPENEGLVPREPIGDTPTLPDDDQDQGDGDQGDQNQDQGGDDGSNDDSGDDSNDSGSDDGGSDDNNGEFFGDSPSFG
jgi:hypothetical protein